MDLYKKNIEKLKKNEIVKAFFLNRVRKHKISIFLWEFFFGVIALKSVATTIIIYELQKNFRKMNI